MDYDDKDFQCHNFQLVGEDIREDNNKFPSVLRSFAPPSFDLDDHLRVHLRCDSLVEPSNILAITGQEENNWIDSFSAGGGAVGISSNVADSCSISRNNNVWSEATSSESVEMLLKSVGEDDMMETKTVSEQPDGDNKLNNLVSTTGNLMSIVPVGPKMEDLGDVDTTAPPEKSHNHSPQILGNAPSANDQAFIGGKPLSSENSDLIGCQLNDADANDTVISLSATSAEEHTHQEEPSIDQKCSERVSEGNCLDCPHLSSHASDDPLISNIRDRSDASHLDVQIVTGSSSATIMDVRAPESSSASESANRASAEQGKVIPCEKRPMLPSCQEVENQSFNSSVHIDECSAAGSSSGAVNPSGSKPQNLNDSSSLLMGGFTELTYSKKSDGLLEVIIGQAKLASSVGDMGSDMPTESKDKPFGLMHDVNDLNVDSKMSIKEDISTTSILLHEVSTTTEVTNADSVVFHKESPEFVQVADTAMLAMVDKNDSSHCQCDNNLNKVAIPKEKAHVLGSKTDKKQASEALVNEKPSDQDSSAKSPVVKNPCKMILSDSIINQPDKLHHESVCHMETDKLGLQVSSLKKEGSTELCHEDVTVAESHDTGMSSSQSIITKEYQSITPGCMNPVSDSENSLLTGMTCDSSDHAKDTLSAAFHDESPKREIVQKDPGDALCPKDHSTEYAVSSKGDESLSVEADNTNLSEHSCGSPNIISLVQHCHDVEGVQEKKKGLADCLQAANDDLHCVSNNGKASCRTESADGNLKENNAFPDDKSFTFEVGDLAEHPEEIAAKGWKPFSSPLSSECSQMTSTKSGYDQCNSTEPRDISQVSQLVSNEGNTHNIGNEGVDMEKALPSTTASVTRRKAKEKSILKKTVEKRENLSNTLASSIGIINRDLQSEERRKHSSTEGTNIKSSYSLSVVASNLPDLNSTTTTLINQPFTDSQQVQLRAQIFVYGSLIQGIPPDEACMVSAFGDVDGGEGSRGKWEGVWCAVAEKYENQKSPLSGCETPTHPVAIPDHALRTSPQSKAISNPTLRAGNKGHGTNIFSPVALPSPVWSVSTHDKLQSNASRTSHLDPSPLLSTLHSYQSQHVRQYSGNSTHWLTQSPCPVPWVVLSNTSTPVTGSKLSISPILDAAQLTPHRDLTVAHSSNIQLQSTSSASPATGNVSSTTEVPVVSGRKKHASSDQKSRRKKRDSVPEEIVQMPLVSEPQVVVEPITRVSQLTCSSTHTSTSSGDSSGSLASTIAPIISPTHFHVVGSGRTEPKIIFSGEAYGKLEQAKLQAEDASSFAVAAVQHSEGIWKQLANQKSSGIVAEVDERLASAAVAAAAAAAVAKAASAAAKLAADSAIQAKLMADEAIELGKADRARQNCESANQYDSGDNLSIVTPASILKCKEKSSSSHSIIPAAREAAQRKLEAALFATKKAENLDAIVKAAELAAEAVSQTGAIVAMGEPLPISFSEILEHGPEGYWRTQHLKGEQILKTNVTHGEQSKFDHLSLNEKDVTETAGRKVGNSSIESGYSDSHQAGNVTGIASSTILVPEEGKYQAAVDPSENVIQEGSVVEVMPDVKGPGSVWYSARVLNIKDSKAYVCYNELLNDEGSDKIKEWIPLDYENDKAPRIRASHPITAKKSEGPRKRQRIETVTHSWDVGDHVDAWITEGWREGVITEKGEGDLTKFVIHFPVGGDTSTVGSWDLRPSLLWREGQWIEWSRSQMNISEHHEGDTPVWKRRKISRTEAKINAEAEGQGVASFSRNVRTDDSQKPENFVPLDLSAKEKFFHLGKGTREDNNSCRIKRTGLQKEGSRVVFGIPKPGKKRKFMDVSKHCVVENPEKMSESVKTSKHLISQSSMGWKNVPKVDVRSKRYMNLKPKIPKPVKPRNSQARNLAEKGNSSIPLLPSNGEGNGGGALSSGKSSGQVDSRMVKKNLTEVGIYANKGTTEGSVLRATTPEVSFVNKSTFDVESVKGNHTDALEILTTNEEVSRASNKVIFDTTEPRRSNRRIQPTSRLLEGLQSSLIIGKIPSASHDRGSKVSHRTVASTRGHDRRLVAE